MGQTAVESKSRTVDERAVYDVDGRQYLPAVCSSSDSDLADGVHVTLGCSVFVSDRNTVERRRTSGHRSSTL